MSKLTQQEAGHILQLANTAKLAWQPDPEPETDAELAAQAAIVVDAEAALFVYVMGLAEQPFDEIAFRQGLASSMLGGGQ